jgi:hypothetical protein
MRLPIFFAVLALTAAARPAAAGPPAPPDLEGVWTTSTLTPLERDPKFGQRLTLTTAEVRAEEARLAKIMAEAGGEGGAAAERPCGLTKESCDIDAAWQEPGSGLLRISGAVRSSILIAPADGRLPLTTYGKAHRMILAGDNLPRDNPEERTLQERCLMFPVQGGPPILPGMYGNYLQIVQTPDNVAISNELIHDLRVVRMAPAQGPAAPAAWMGSSVGRWEGAVLVVETTGLHPAQSTLGQTPAARITERFTRISADQLLYRFRIDDPVAYLAPVEGELVLQRAAKPLLEYACHEGDRGMEGILGGARYEEKAGR